jgi:hypothetical protein
LCKWHGPTWNNQWRCLLLSRRRHPSHPMGLIVAWQALYVRTQPRRPLAGELTGAPSLSHRSSEGWSVAFLRVRR